MTNNIIFHLKIFPHSHLSCASSAPNGRGTAQHCKRGGPALSIPDAGLVALPRGTGMTTAEDSRMCSAGYSKMATASVTFPLVVCESQSNSISRDAE